MLTILLACGAMATRDALSTFLVVAEARGRALLSGALDATGDLASILVTVVGAGAVITHGLTAHTIALLAAMTVTSFAGTTLWTRLAARWITNPAATLDRRRLTRPTNPEIGITTSDAGGQW